MRPALTPSLTLSALLALGGEPARAAPPAPAAVMVPEGVPGPGPVVARRTALSAAIAGERLSLSWAGSRLLISDEAGGLTLVDPATGAVAPATLPSLAPPKKGKSKKPPPAVPVVATAAAAGHGGAAAILAEGYLWVFDAATGAVRWKQPAGGATNVQWSVDGVAVAAGGNQRHVVWAASSGTPMEAPDTRAALHTYAALQQRLLVAVGGRLELYDTGGTTALVEQASVAALALSPDGRRAAAGGEGLWLFDAEARAPLGQRALSGVRALRYAPDGARLAVLGEGLSVVDAASGALLAQLWTERPPTGVIWTADGELLWTDGVALYQAPARGGDLAAALSGSAQITALAASGGRVAAGDAGGGVAVWGPDGALERLSRGAGTVTRLAFDAEGQTLAVRQSADHLLKLSDGADSPCAATVPVCAALDEAPPPVPLLQDRLGPQIPAVSLGQGAASAAGEALWIWDASGQLSEARWVGDDGAWGRYAEGLYRWGGMKPAFKVRDSGEPVLPPLASAQLMLDRPTVTLVEGGPPASLTLLLTNTGPGAAYALQVKPNPSGGLKLSAGLEQPRFGAGERLLLPVTVAAPPGRTGDLSGELIVSTLFGGPVAYPVAAHIAPFPVRVEKFKRKGNKLRVDLSSAGDPLLKDARVWLAVQGQGGAWTAVTSGEAGKLKPFTGEHKPTEALLFDTLDLSGSGATALEYRLPDKNPPKAMDLIVLIPGGAPRSLSLAAPP